MLDLALKLLDRVIDLEKRREQQRSDLFKNFVEPIWEDFEKLHQDYLTTVRRYDTLIRDESKPFNHSNPIFAEIELDSMVSDDLRARFLFVKRADPRMEVLGPFRTSIVQYLSYGPQLWTALPWSENARPFWQYNMPRLALVSDFRAAANARQSDEERRALARFVIKRMLFQLQGNFSRVAEEFNALKLFLLKPTYP